jgi:uncharacterized protein (UPF0332 family)
VRPGDHHSEPVLVRKARSALAAARVVVDAHPDSAASRAYYAVHHALRWRYGGDLPRRHGGVNDPGVLARVGLSRTDGDEIIDLQRLRRRGDYDERRHVDSDAACASIDVAAELLQRLGIDL